MDKYTINFAGCDTVATAETYGTAIKKAMGLLRDKVPEGCFIDIEHSYTLITETISFVSTVYAYNEKTKQTEMVFIYGPA